MRMFLKLNSLRKPSVHVKAPGVLALRWRLQRCCFCSSPQNESSNISVLRHLTSKIKATGPISVAEYMKEVLANPVSGYYVRNDMLGADGDFITSPEISQIFGELLGIWCVSEWMAAGKPKHFQLVEFGPGRGSLVTDILRVFSQLGALLQSTNLSVHLVEVSPRLSQVQAQNLTGEDSQSARDENEPAYRRGTTATGLPVSWYRRIEDVPVGFSLYLAHEFFDALPIHKFQRTERGWREVMVDIDPDMADRLRFVLIPAPTLASSTLIQADEQRTHVEVCPEGGVIIQKLTNRIAEYGGAALIADYGHDGTKTDTFRGFRGHKLHDPLEAPGTADLTADVDFSYLRRMAGTGVACLGPITQRHFLHNMGISIRLQDSPLCISPGSAAELPQRLYSAAPAPGLRYAHQPEEDGRALQIPRPAEPPAPLLSSGRHKVGEEAPSTTSGGWIQRTGTLAGEELRSTLREGVIGQA
ncbi:protein arginine methyltransferase NDUFAF7, mitochondrial isoform X2 [Paramormyrops kingsleyae]|uniref:protein arginine methyltransferase NDUFAF7, mitochondrial isoform X2 n=1 Tax=Paramormyrops kingsleyae TaxID=1676925 RepID=UPI003B977598